MNYLCLKNNAATNTSSFFHCLLTRGFRQAIHTVFSCATFRSMHKSIMTNESIQNKTHSTPLTFQQAFVLVNWTGWWSANVAGTAGTGCVVRGHVVEHGCGCGCARVRRNEASIVAFLSRRDHWKARSCVPRVCGHRRAFCVKKNRQMKHEMWSTNFWVASFSCTVVIELSPSY